MKSRMSSAYSSVKTGLEGIVSGFTPQFENQKQLARKLRPVLFPIRYNVIFTGTFRDKDIMYDRMINAFKRAIDRPKKEKHFV